MTLCGLMVAVGLLFGYFVPDLAQSVIDYKGKQKNRVMPDQPAFLSIWCKLICAVLTGAGLGVCGYFAPSIILLFLAILIWVLGMVIVLVDMRIRIIANESLLILLGLALLFRILTGGLMGLLNSFLTMIVVEIVWLTLGKVLGFWQVGAGDVKLCGVIAFMFGMPYITTPLLVMAVSLLLFCLGGLALRKLTLRSAFPMGPFLAAGMLAGVPYVFYMLSL